jgi:uncharacterized protein YecT (DUF1311 family)
MIIAMLLAISVNTFAKSNVDECVDKASSNNAMKQCVYAEYHDQDLILNDEYKKLIAELKKDNSDDGKIIIDRVVNNQRAWIAMRDTTCDVEGIDMLGGSGEGLIVGGCLGRETASRVEKIKEIQKNLAPLSFAKDMK